MARGSLLAALLEVEIYRRRKIPEAVSREEYERRFPHDGRLLNQIFGPPADSDASQRPANFVPSLSQVREELPQGERIGPYYKVGNEPLGRGGMGEVWLAEDYVGRRVAVKIPRADLTKEQQVVFTLREARVHLHLDHPRIVRILETSLPRLDRTMSDQQMRDALRNHGPIYIAMAYIEPGRTLADIITGWVIKGSGRPSIEHIVGIIVDVAEALEYLHSRAPAIYHSDLKPGNVLIDSDGRAYLADFGLAVNEYEQDHHPKSGTRLYKSPEQYSGKTDSHAASDIWALGIVFYQLLTGRLPFHKDGDVCDVRYEPIPIRQHDHTIPEPLIALCNRCLSKNAPNAPPRYQNVRIVIETLTEWLTSRTVEDVPDSAAGGVLGKLRQWLIGSGRRQGDWEVDIDTHGVFIGRDEQIQSLSRLLQYKPSRVVIAGSPGLGKTLLAVRYARSDFEKGRYPGGVVLVEAADGLEKGFAKLNDKRAKCLLAMRERADALIIIDDLREEDEVELNRRVFGGYVPLSFQCRILITNWGQVPANFKKFKLESLAKSAALQLLLQHRPEILKDPHCAPYCEAQDLCVMADNLPLILAIAAAFLKQKRTKGPADFIGGWRENASPNFTGIQAEHLATRHNTDIGASLEIPWTCLGEDARLLLRIAGRRPNVTLPIARLRRLAPLSPDRCDDALIQLCDDYSLAERQKENLFLHWHVHEFAKAKADEADPDEAMKCFSHLVEDYDFDVSLLAEQCIKRGPTAVQEDLDAASALVGKTPEFQPGEEQIEDRRKSLVSFLQHEGNKLGKSFSSDLNGQRCVVQQLQYWAVDMGETGLADRARKFLQVSGPFLRLRRQWRRQSPELISPPLTGHRHNVNAVAVTPDGQWCLSASEDRQLKLWHLPSRKEIQTFAGHDRAVWSACLSDDGRIAASAADDRTVRIWSHDRPGHLHKLQDKKERDWVNVVVMSSDNRYAISGADDGSITSWDLRNGTKIQTIDRDQGHHGWVLALAIHQNGRFISGSQDRTLKSWTLDLATGRMNAVAPYILEGHDSWVRGLVLTPDGHHAVSASNDTTLKIWDLTTGNDIRTLKGHSASVRGVALASSKWGQLVVSGSDDETIKIWDLKTGELLRTLSGHCNLVRSIATASSDGGCFAVSASFDRTLCVWDLSNIHSSPADHLQGVRSISFTSAETALVRYADESAVTATLHEAASRNRSRPEI